MIRPSRVRKLINLDIKKEIISERESGKGVGDLSAEYGMANLTISTIFVVYFFIRKILLIIFTKESLFMLFKFTRTTHKILIKEFYITFIRIF